ncbi:3-mercaptopyruvate sulfurtransferase [Marinimicrobium sp. ABcell2]|uniref:3-mercaptopyruvate sulfurtransferase n=1 Tax=Marinimicrobium sp. ABcell2 TaxID=3069751 RepID=UPI0027B28EE5|nr:3-mercaptopyruvate sulfurtransferase [Marinimicrobium sp. ABcell2]MDQ2076760.1 3-mercaptopyruvate sulfurtransferase [Marinimicrobium sp. ABcell2]
MNPTVSCSWLQERMSEPDCIILDASLTPVGGEGQSPASSCIPGAVRFDLEELSDTSSQLPHSLLGPMEFQRKVRQMGVNADSTVVVYDNNGIYSSPRAWWNFKLTGHDDVYVLDGGINEWNAQGLESTNQHKVIEREGDFVATPRDSMTSSVQDVLAAIHSPAHQIIDLRSAPRYGGEQDEPRPGLRRGHVPSAVNIPFSELFDGHRLKEPKHLKEFFERAGCSTDQYLIFYCGSGVTACIGILAAFACGFSNVSLYDGSWAEWGAEGSLPIANQ